MSSILNALKKAEQDGSLYKNNPDLNLNVQRILSAKERTPTKKLALNTPKIMLVFCITISIGLLSFFIFSTNNDPQKTAFTNPGIAQTTNRPAVIPAQKIPQQAPAKQYKKIIIPEPGSSSVDTKPEAPNIKSTPKNIPIENSIDEIKGETIKIQAISWSIIPEDRIAVINDNIVSENDSILDYRIVNIRKDEIILMKSNQKFSLKFRYR